MTITGKKLVADLIDQMKEMNLPHMADSLDRLFRSDDFAKKDSLTVLNDILTPEYEARMGTRLKNRLAEARLSNCPQDITMCVDSAQREYQPMDITATLKTLDFVDEGLNVCILGPSDSGKSYLAKALGIHACCKFTVAYFHCEPLLEELSSMKNTSYEKFQKRMSKLVKKQLLILDDFLLHTITEEREVKILFELLEKRSELNNSTIVCSQREPKSWTSMIYNDEVAANALLKRATKHYTVVIQPK